MSAQNSITNHQIVVERFGSLTKWSSNWPDNQQTNAAIPRAAPLAWLTNQNGHVFVQISLTENDYAIIKTDKGHVCPEGGPRKGHGAIQI